MDEGANDDLLINLITLTRQETIVMDVLLSVHAYNLLATACALAKGSEAHSPVECADLYIHRLNHTFAVRTEMCEQQRPEELYRISTEVFDELVQAIKTFTPADMEHFDPLKKKVVSSHLERIRDKITISAQFSFTEAELKKNGAM